MKIKKRKVWLLIALVLLIVIFLILFWTLGSNNKKEGLTNICQTINVNINDKKNFVIFVSDNNLNGNTDIIDYLKEEYSDLNVYNIAINNVNNSCIKEILDENGIYEMVTSNDTSSMIVYKEGIYQGVYVGINNYEEVKDYLVELGIVEFINHNTINFSDFNKKISLDNYLILLIVTENLRDDLEKKMNEFYKDYDYDIVNISEEEGKKIFEFINKENEIINEYPRLLLFSKGNLEKNEFVIDDSHFQNFKNYLEK